ncbi:hypothetical protein HRG_002194 [Hirsutella rhossiliensis]|uniref:Uncharacterized protein n=1 Tax=Hirsutella rhossiliensis TaxID=111463 RepID=A0A9P8SMF0_9HYPO|nr:uncharacterized protein HRG_02194 [Hirsutella rhossiliensis]KAH0966785.1 hypothetical protein HRG_02194 [Hirsutella rhossiliensis]
MINDYDGHGLSFQKYPNENIKAWVIIPLETVAVDRIGQIDIGIRDQYSRFLTVPNYTFFSNALETPHNAIHLAVGGVQVTKVDAQAADVPDYRGDMGEN